MMAFPDTWEEYEKSYGFDDSEEIYTNGSRLIPSFRVKQWLEHLPSAQPKTGRWIEVHGFCTPGGDPVWACSECGKGVHVYGVEHNSYGRDVSDCQWKACPNCGCRMEGEEND